MQVDCQTVRKRELRPSLNDGSSASQNLPIVTRCDDITVQKATNVTDMITQLAVSPHVGDVTESRQRHDEVRVISLDERKSTAMQHMHERIAQRQKEWDIQVDRMKRDFFRQPPWSSSPTSSGSIQAASVSGEQLKRNDEKTVAVQQQQQQPPSVTLNAMHSKMNLQPATATVPEFRVSTFFKPHTYLWFRQSSPHRCFLAFIRLMH
jgi:hypothetical protein